MDERCTVAVYRELRALRVLLARLPESLAAEQSITLDASSRPSRVAFEAFCMTDGSEVTLTARIKRVELSKGACETSGKYGVLLVCWLLLVYGR